MIAAGHAEMCLLHSVFIVWRLHGSIRALPLWSVCDKGSPLVAAGRNIHALDPYRMPSQAALERGSAVAQGIIDSHMQANAGAYPETVAVSPEVSAADMMSNDLQEYVVTSPPARCSNLDSSGKVQAWPDQ